MSLSNSGASAISSGGGQTAGDQSQITHVLNKDKKYLSEHGQKLFNAINCLLDDNEQLELTQALFKYQRDHNVFTLVRSCRELFDTSKKKSLMLFMRPVIPVKDRFHYDEYYKLFFPEEFSQGVVSIFKDLIPKDLLEKTLKKAEDKKQANLEREREREMRREKEKEEHIKLLEQVNYDLSLDIEKLLKSKMNLKNESPVTNSSNYVATPTPSTAIAITATSSTSSTDSASITNNEHKTKHFTEKKIEKNEFPDPVRIAGFRIIELEPKDDEESLGFDICMGPTGTFIMISYVEPNSLVEKLGMRIGDELVSVNEISFKMIELDQAIEILATLPTLHIVLQTSGFMPEVEPNERLSSNSGVSEFSGDSVCAEFSNEWIDAFDNPTQSPADSKPTIKKYIRRLVLRPRKDETDFGIRIRGGIEFSLGIFISYVKPKSTADLVGLKVCDQIIDVNGQKFSRISHEDAQIILNASLINYRANNLPIKIAVRYLGKLPVLKLTDLKAQETVDTPIELVKDGVEKKIQLLSHSSLNSIRNLFINTPRNFELFKYYLREYLQSKINIQYFLYLLINRLQLNKKHLIERQDLNEFIKREDLSIFKRTLLWSPEISDLQNENVRFLTDDFKNSLIVRSTEVLNDLNINPSSKLNKYENFATCQNLSLHKKKTICKSLDCLNPSYW